MELVDGLGAVPYIAFKTNTTGEKGGVLAKMFHLYEREQLNRWELAAA
jgi:hypothetical protein